MSTATPDVEQTTDTGTSVKVDVDLTREIKCESRKRDCPNPARWRWRLSCPRGPHSWSVLLCDRCDKEDRDFLASGGTVICLTHHPTPISIQRTAL